MKKPNDCMYSVNDVSKIIGVSTRTVRRWIEQELIAIHRFGGQIRIAEADLQAFIASRRIAGKL